VTDKHLERADFNTVHLTLKWLQPKNSLFHVVYTCCVVQFFVVTRVMNWWYRPIEKNRYWVFRFDTTRYIDIETIITTQHHFLCGGLFPFIIQTRSLAIANKPCDCWITLKSGSYTIDYTVVLIGPFRSNREVDGLSDVLNAPKQINDASVMRFRANSY